MDTTVAMAELIGTRLPRHAEPSFTWAQPTASSGGFIFDNSTAVDIYTAMDNYTAVSARERRRR